MKDISFLQTLQYILIILKESDNFGLYKLDKISFNYIRFKSYSFEMALVRIDRATSDRKNIEAKYCWYYWLSYNLR